MDDGVRNIFNYNIRKHAVGGPCDWQEYSISISLVQKGNPW